MDSITLKEVEEYCSSWKMENTWKLAREVSDRIHDEPGPGKHDVLTSVSSHSKKQQILHLLAKYLIQCKKAPSSKRSKMRGNAFFLKLQKLKEDHVRQGHYYLEYLKFTCEPNCESCKQEGWSAGVPGNWFPVPGPSDTGYIPSRSDQIDQYLPSIQVKRLFASGKLTSNGNELQKVRQELMVDENACKSFVEHQEFLAMKAQKRASERNTVPNIDWNNEDHVSSLTAHKLRLIVPLRQHNLQVRGGKATLAARVLRYIWAAQQILEPEDNDATSDSELQSSDSEDPDDSEDDAPAIRLFRNERLYRTQLRGILCPRH